MNIIIDTNILVRISVDDEQSGSARELFQKALTVTITTHVFCEYAWVLSSVYNYGKSEIARAIREFMNNAKVLLKEDEVEAGLQMLEDGGDFADGVISYAGRAMAPSPETFVSFDKRAVRLLAGRGQSALTPF